MEKASPSALEKSARWLGTIGIWLALAWLLYPLVFELITPPRATEYFYRSAAGIIIMIILFGKTLFDLLFPQDLARGRSALNVVLLAVYALVLAGGIIFVLLRVLMGYLGKNSAAFNGSGVSF